jgi:anti-sigma regulatory factor (Ser/Thr protein kinase)
MERYFPRSIDALGSVFDFVEETLSDRGLDADALSRVSLVIEELFTNFVKYNRSDREIAVRIDERGGRVTVRLTDFDVEPFDVTRVPEEAAPREGAGGFGLRLVRRLTESLAYEYRDGRSRVTAGVRTAP